jgi:ribosomal protein S16
MRRKNYAHNVIRIRKGKPNKNQVYWLIAILNKKKMSSHKIVERLGFFKYGNQRLLALNYYRLAYYLNKGYILNNTCKKFIYLNTAI